MNTVRAFILPYADSMEVATRRMAHLRSDGKPIRLVEYRPATGKVVMPANDPHGGLKRVAQKILMLHISNAGKPQR
jgi:hypothetical protein